VLTKTKPKRKTAPAAEIRGASKPETLPASFKDIAHAVRENFERKAAALYERWKKGDVDLQSSDVELLKKVPTQTISRHELERAMALFDLHGRKSKGKPSTAIAVRPAALPAVVVERAHSLTAGERALIANFEKAWLSFGRNFLALGETVIRAEEAGLSVDALIAATGLSAARSTAYAAAKATRLWKVFEPFASPARIVLDCESQFRDFPADLELSTPEARKIVKLIERDTEPDKRGQHRPTREQLKPIIAATVGLRGFGPEKRKPQPRDNQAESRLQEPTAEMPSRTSTAEPPMEAPETSPGMFGRGVEQAAWEDSGETQEERLGAAFRGQAPLIIDEYDGLIPPEGLPDEERQNWHDVLQSFSKETCQMAQYYRRYPGVGRKLQGFFLHLAKLVEITCTQEFPAGHEPPAKKRRAK
jgi:hypothetical protein